MRDVRADAPAMAPDFRARLDMRIERGFERVLPRRRFASLRPMVPALGAAGCVLAAVVAVVVLSAGGGSNDGAGSSSGAGVAAPPATQEQSQDAAKSSGSAGSGSAGSGSAGSGSTGSGKTSSAAPAAPAVAPNGSTPARQRRVERSTRLELTTTDVQTAGDGVVRATQAAGGFVQSSQIATGNGHSTASFILRVPTSRLDDALARLSRLGHVKSLQQSADDITNAYNGASARLAEARAERSGCCARCPRRRLPRRSAACARASPTTAARCSATSASWPRCATAPTTPRSASRSLASPASTPPPLAAGRGRPATPRTMPSASSRSAPAWP